MSQKKEYFTLQEIQSYSWCPRQYYIEYVLNYNRFNNSANKFFTTDPRAAILLSIMKDSIEKTILDYIEKRNSKEEPNQLQMQEMYSQLFYKNCSLKDIFETELSTKDGVPVFSKGLKTINAFYEAFYEDVFSPIIANKTYEIPINGFNIRGKIDGIFEREISKNTSNHLDIFYLDHSSVRLVDRSDFFCTTNSDVNFAGTLLRDELGFKETRIIGFNLIGNYKKIYPALSDNKVESFKNATASICERINKEEYDYLASKAHCSSCQYLEFCKNLR